MLSDKQARLAELERQVERVQRRNDRVENRSSQLGQMELGIFVFGVLISIFALVAVKWLGVAGFVITGIAFGIAVRNHGRVLKSIVRHGIWLKMKKMQVARAQLDWDALPPDVAGAPEGDHPFEIDLDITGNRSLHRLINTGVSVEGSQRLLEWLLTTEPDLETIRQRQVLIRELTPLTLFRNKLMVQSLLAARLSSDQLEGERLLEWLETQESAKVSGLTLFVATLLSAITLLLIVLLLFGLVPLWAAALALICSLAWFLLRRDRRGGLSEDANFLRLALGQLSTIFEHLEKYPYGQHEHLKSLCEPFYRHPDYRPSQVLKKLSRLATRAVLEKEVVLWLVVNAFIPWDFYITRQLNTYREQLAKRLPAWLETWFELEALCSLANFAYLNPEYIMPKLVPGGEQQAVFCGIGLGHPLLQPDKKVINDYTIDEANEIMMITGSNMAGKSTFLRTLGINLCLAYAGGPVNATSLQTSLFEIYGCIKVSDSVTDGYSYFYAEVRRLKGLLEKLESGSRYPAFFLIDEIFKGTNNRERLIGSEAYIHALVGKNCVGAISTHDLELVKLAETLPNIKNYHFREEVIEGRMAFDYLLRSGPCPTTNALKIMQIEGLPITVD